MINEVLTDLDLFNYYAIDFLELGSNFSPKQAEIDCVEQTLKQFFKWHVSNLRCQLRFDAEDER